jgi:hypothetical protein
LETLKAWTKTTQKRKDTKEEEGKTKTFQRKTDTLNIRYPKFMNWKETCSMEWNEEMIEMRAV